MPNQGNWNMNTTASPGAGYYSGLTSTVTPTNVCSGTSIFGAAGVAACESGTTSSPAGAANILAGNEAWDANGNKMTGTMTNQGALNAQNTFPGAGYYNGTVTNAPLASQIATGTTVLGAAGTYAGTFTQSIGSGALRDAGVAVVPQLSGQTTSYQIPLSAETTTYATSSLPSGAGYHYRDIPDSSKDDDKLNGVSCAFAPRPSNDCGKSQSTIALRVADCAVQNPTTASWNGSTQCSGGQGTWNLVTRDGANEEVWQDTRTGLVWSSQVATAANWCQASGNTQNAAVYFSGSYHTAAGTPITGNGKISAVAGGSSSASETVTIKFTNATTFTVSGANCGGGAITSGALTTTAGSSVTWSRANYCSFTITQGATNFAANDYLKLTSIASTYSCAPGAASGLQPASPLSYCAEADGAFTSYPPGENWATGTYMPAKGLMGENSTPSVRWRLPTLPDFEIALVDGIDHVMPDMGYAGSMRPNNDESPGGFGGWTATLYPTHNAAWFVNYIRQISSTTFNVVTDVQTEGTEPILTRCVGR